MPASAETLSGCYKVQSLF